MIRILLITGLLLSTVQAAETLTVQSKATQTAVVELYTSEGCSSCPPADQWFEALVELPTEEVDVLAIAFHVDYWDYLGWKDRFASSRYTSRQKQLGANNRQGSIYTPEFFVDGKEARGTRNVIEKIRVSNQIPAQVSLKLSITKSTDTFFLELQSSTTDNAAENLHYRLIVYENNLKTDVKRGENAGELLKHQQVVRFMSPALALKSESKYRIPIELDWQLKNVGIAAIVTSRGSEDYLQAVHTSVASLVLP